MVRKAVMRNDWIAVFHYLTSWTDLMSDNFRCHIRGNPNILNKWNSFQLSLSPLANRWNYVHFISSNLIYLQVCLVLFFSMTKWAIGPANEKNNRWSCKFHFYFQNFLRKAGERNYKLFYFSPVTIIIRSLDLAYVHLIITMGQWQLNIFSFKFCGCSQVRIFILNVSCLRVSKCTRQTCQ